MSLTPSTLRLDLKCGQGAIAQGKTCHKGGAIPRRAALAAGLTAGAVGGALLFKGSRKAIFNAPGRARRAAQQGVTEAVHRATAKPPSMRFPEDGPLATMRPPSKTERLHKAAQSANREAEQAISKAAQAEIERTVAVASAMHKSGKAARASVRSGVRRHNLTIEKLRRRYEPGYRKPRFSDTPRGDALLTPRLLRSFPISRNDACWEGYVQAGTKRKGKREVPNCVPTSSGLRKAQAQKDTEDGKKYTKVVTNPKTGRKNKVRYGAKGYTIAPGTSKGDNYCARSFGDMKSEGYDCSGAERNTPLCLSRAKWKCSGKTSRRDAALTPGKSSAW